MFKTIILINFALILISLAAGAIYLAKDEGSDSKSRVVTSLTFRIVLSFTLFGLLFVGYLTDQITPHGLMQ